MTMLLRATMISAALVWCAPRAARAQATPVPPPASSPAPVAPRVEVLPGSQPPDSNAVALCMDGSWIKTPGVVANCGTHGGLKVAMPAKRVPPPAPSAIAQPLFQAQAVESAPPTNATGRCKDGTYVTGTIISNTCFDRGGLATSFPPPRTAPIKPPDR